MPGCAAHGDTLATRDSPRQCATTRPRVDTALNRTPPGSTERERKENLHRRETFGEKVGLLVDHRGQAGQTCEERDDDQWLAAGSVKRKAALRRRRWSFYSAPTLIFQNRRVAYLTVSSPSQTAAAVSSKPCCFGILTTFKCETGRRSLELWHQSRPRAAAY